MMRIVATNSVMMAISAYVSYMKQTGYNRDNLIMQKDRMLSSLNGQINRAIRNNTNNQPMTHTCYWMDKYTPVTWYFTFYVLPQQNLVVVMQFYSKENGKSVNEGRQVIRLDETGLKEMIAESLREALNEIFEPVGKIDEFEIIDGSWGTKRCDSLKNFGYYNDVRMYYSNEHTYCLMRREDNGTFFFAEIVPAPELGKNETKYEPKRPSDIPNKILRDAKKFLHNNLILEK